MNNRVFDFIILVPITMLIASIVLLISMLIRHGVPKKMCVYVYKFCKTKDKSVFEKVDSISIKNMASNEVKNIKNDMKLCKKVISRKQDNVDIVVCKNKKTDIQTIDKIDNDKKIDTSIIENSFDYLCNEIITQTDDEIK